MRVNDLMTTEVSHIDPDRSVAEAALAMLGAGTGSLVVIENDRIEGVITERDVLRVVAEGADPNDLVAREIMNKDGAAVSSDTRLSEAARVMIANKLNHLPVVDSSGQPEGLLSMRDVMTVFSPRMGEPEPPARSSGGTLSRTHRLELIEAGDLD